MQIEAEKIARAYREFKSNLTPREREIVTKYYGIEKEVRHTLAELGEMQDVTRERIRQIKVVALGKLKIKAK